MDIDDVHARLDETTLEAVREITNLAATMKVLERADDQAIATAFETSAEALTALADFLDALAEAAGDGGFHEEVQTRLVELEPPPGPDEVGGEPVAEDENPFVDISPLRRLSAPYSVLLNLERDLYADRIRRPFRVRKLKEIWGDLSRIGSPHPSDGLTARLGRLSEYLDGGGSDDPGVPWSSADRRAVRRLADRTETIGAWDDDERHRRERDAWVERVRDWVETVEDEPESVAHMSEMLTRFLTDMPPRTTPDVRMILERILDLEELPDDLRRKAETAVNNLEE